MEKIRVPDRNTFEEKAKAFAQSRLGRKLAKKYTPKPYEERRRGLYYFAWAASFFCNGVAVVTGSTFVFAYALGLLATFPEPMILAGIVAGVALIGIEALKQLLVPDLFQDFNQYRKINWLQLVAIVGLIAVSTMFNYFGGFDFTKAVSKAPQFEAPELKSADQVRAEYSPRIEEAGKEAQDYRQSKLWDGRLSDDNAKVYRELLEGKKELEREMLTKLNDVETYNDQATATAKQEHRDKVTAHESKTAIRGRGLAVFSVVCELLFILFCWYREHYEYKTATQYAVEDEDDDPEDTEHGNRNTGDPIGWKQQSYNGNGHSHSGATNQVKKTIGFVTAAQRKQEQETGETAKQGKEASVITRFYADTHTIVHNGKRLRLVDVNRRVNTYRERVKQSQETGETETAERRQEQLSYWKRRRAELLEKMGRATVQA